MFDGIPVFITLLDKSVISSIMTHHSARLKAAPNMI